MTKIAGIPDQLDGVAASMQGTAGDLSALATRLAAIDYPEMPPATATAVRGLVGAAGSRLRRDAIVADTSSSGVKKRAAWFRAADVLLASPALHVTKGVVEMFDSSLEVEQGLRVEQMMSEWERWNRVVPDVIHDWDEESMAATRIWFIFQERSPLPYTRFLSMLEGAGEREAYAASAEVPLLATRSIAGKILGPLGVYTNLKIAIHPDYGGVRGDVDRGMAILGATGSMGQTMLVLGIGAEIPGVDIVVGGILVGVAAWQVGNILWDEKGAIARGAVKGGKFLYQHAGWAAGPLGQLAWEHRGEAVHAAVSGVEWGVDHGKDIATTGLGIAEGGLHDAKGLGSGLAHDGEDLGKTVVGGLSSGVSKVFGGL
jgi:hypothetical protein